MGQKSILRASRGFTLIELLVVIAIIGLLAAVVLASVGNARSKGADAAVQSSLHAAQTQAEIFASSHSNSYANLCGTASGAFGGTNATGMLMKVGAITGHGVAGDINIANGTAGTAGHVTCHATTYSWAVEAPLSNGQMWCVDSNGASRNNGAVHLGVSDYTC